MDRWLTRSRAAMVAVLTLAVATAIAVPVAVDGTAGADTGTPATPIRHLVVIFQENVSFDHYFGTYPNATNTSGNYFSPAPGTPSVTGLTPALLTENPNGVNPRRLDPANINDMLICDQDHGYTAEQQAFDNGAMDKFPAFTGTSTGTSPTGQPCKASDVMNYYDGNAVTALWNYAQHFAMSDNSFGTTFGPSSPGAINLASGDTGDVVRAIRGAADPVGGDIVPDGLGLGSLIDDAQPFYDDCSSRDAVAMGGENIGDELNAANLSWGWFEGGFRPTKAYSGPGDSVLSYDPEGPNPGAAVCGASHPIGLALGGTGTTGAHPYGVKSDYIPHHEPFQYYASTANPHHLAPTSLAAIGVDTAAPGEFNTANHQYDTSDFDALVAAIHAGLMPPSSLPAVSFLKAPGYEDGHAGYSDPTDEQVFITNEINSLEELPDWSSTAVIISYDDSDGFYDHVYSGVHNPSQTSADVLNGPGLCVGINRAQTPLADQQGRCGYGPRLPLLVISPWAKGNYVSDTVTDQSSIIKFIQYNWHLPPIPGSFANIAGSLKDMFNFPSNGHGGNARATHATKGHAAAAGKTPKLFLNPKTGEPERAPILAPVKKK